MELFKNLQSIIINPFQLVPISCLYTFKTGTSPAPAVCPSILQDVSF